MPGQQQRARVKAVKHLSELYFAFLELPAELRNKIYEYTLTTSEGLKVCWQTGKDRRRKKPVMLVNREDESYPINQLQYVNRQLCKEAAGLEIQYNSLTFTTYPRTIDGHALKAAYIFTSSCTPVRQRWLTHIVLEGLCIPPSRPDKTSMIDWAKYHMKSSGIFSFCQGLPHIRVDYRFPGFAYAEGTDFCFPRSFVTKAALIMRLFRGTDLLYLKCHDGSLINNIMLDDLLVEKLGRELTEELGRLISGAPKLQIYPVDKALPAEEFSDTVDLGWRSVTAAQAFLASGGAKLWTDEAQRWIREGI